MGILFMEGFEAKALADYWSVVGSAAIGSSCGRRSSKGCDVPGGAGGTHSISRTFTSSKTIVFGVAYKREYYDTKGFQIQFYDESTLKAYLEITTSGATFKNAAGDALGTSFTVSKVNWNYIEIKMDMGNSDSNGSYSIQVDEVAKDSGTALDLGQSGDYHVNKVVLYCDDVYQAYVDDIYLTDGTTFLGDCRVDAIVPSGAGTTTQWTPSTGSNYACVDEIPASDTDYVSTDVLDGIDTYAMGDLPEDASGDIYGVALHFRAKRDTIAAKIKPIVRVGSTNYEGTEITLTETWTNYLNLWDVNPADSAAWETADINGLECGVTLSDN